jgi:hypothetical protein
VASKLPQDLGTVHEFDWGTESITNSPADETTTEPFIELRIGGNVRKGFHVP